MVLQLLERTADLIAWRWIDFCITNFGVDFVTGCKIRKMPSLERIGSAYGGWTIPTHLLGDSSICYCAGVGEDITFDLGLIARFNCEVYAFDPTPRAKLHVQRHAQKEKRFHFIDLGLWDRDEAAKFYAPTNPDHVSHSILNLQKTNTYFTSECNRLSTIMQTNGHSQLALLKLDIEGAEYKVIDSVIEDKLDIDIICVEYDEAYNSLDKSYLKRIKRSVLELCKHNYTVVAVDHRCNYTFVKSNLTNH